MKLSETISLNRLDFARTDIWDSIVDIAKEKGLLKDLEYEEDFNIRVGILEAE